MNGSSWIKWVSFFTNLQKKIHWISLNNFQKLSFLRTLWSVHDIISRKNWHWYGCKLQLVNEEFVDSCNREFIIFIKLWHGQLTDPYFDQISIWNSITSVRSCSEKTNFCWLAVNCLLYSSMKIVQHMTSNFRLNLMKSDFGLVNKVLTSTIFSTCHLRFLLANNF